MSLVVVMWFIWAVGPLGMNWTWRAGIVEDEDIRFGSAMLVKVMRYLADCAPGGCPLYTLVDRQLETITLEARN